MDQIVEHGATEVVPPAGHVGVARAPEPPIEWPLTERRWIQRAAAGLEDPLGVQPQEPEHAHRSDYRDDGNCGERTTHSQLPSSPSGVIPELAQATVLPSEAREATR